MEKHLIGAKLNFNLKRLQIPTYGTKSLQITENQSKLRSISVEKTSKTEVTLTGLYSIKMEGMKKSSLS